MEPELKEYTKEKLKIAVDLLGIERVAECLESICNPIFRAKIRVIFGEMYNY